MDIITFSEGLQQRIKEIDALASGQSDLLKTGQALRFIREIVGELKTFTVKYTFSDKQEEIRFFKEMKPVLLSQYYYYKKMFSIRLYDSFRDRKSRINNYHTVLDKLQRYARKHQDFYQYCMSGETHFDVNYFTRSGKVPRAVDLDEKFSTGYDNMLAKILAHELTKNFVLDALQKLQQDKSGLETIDLSWTDSKVALVELVYALHAAGVFNHGKADVKQIVRSFETMFGIDLGSYAKAFSEIKIRKSGQTNFLDALKERLTKVTRYSTL